MHHQPSLELLLSGDQWVFDAHTFFTNANRQAVKYVGNNRNRVRLLHDYKGSWFNLLNKTLRSHAPTLEGELAELDAFLTKTISLQTWSHPAFTLFRSIEGAYAKAIAKLSVGDVFVNKAYSSTAFDVKRALSLSGTHMILLIIQLRENTPFLYIDAFKDRFCKSGNPDDVWVFQSEILLGKNVHYKILNKSAHASHYVHLNEAWDCRFPSFRKTAYTTIHVEAFVE